jgi:very-short-patch-repair endonuclease
MLLGCVSRSTGSSMSSFRRADEVRDRYLADQGVRTLRFHARDVLTNLSGVVQAISVALQTPPSAFG